MKQSKLIGKTIEDFIHDVIFEYITEINFRDGEQLEYMLSDFEERVRSNAIYELEEKCTILEDDLQSAESRIDYLEDLLQENEIEYE
jgi:hypothetical protein